MQHLTDFLYDQLQVMIENIMLELSKTLGC